MGNILDATGVNAQVCKQLGLVSLGAKFVISSEQYCGWLLLEDQCRAADLVAFELDVDFNSIGDFDEGDTAVHPILLTVEGHGATDRAVASPFALQR